MLDLMPEPAHRRQRHRRGVEGPADAPLPACDPTRQRLFLSKAEQGKLADLTKILGDHMVGLRVRRVAVVLRRRVFPPRKCLLWRAPPKDARLVSTH